MVDKSSGKRLEFIESAIALALERRDAELREAFRDSSAFNELILEDCAAVVAGIGGYAVPVDKPAREEWIREKMLKDAAFVSKVHVVKNLVREYLAFAAGRRGESTW